MALWPVLHAAVEALLILQPVLVGLEIGVNVPVDARVGLEHQSLKNPLVLYRFRG